MPIPRVNPPPPPFLSSPLFPFSSSYTFPSPVPIFFLSTLISFPSSPSPRSYHVPLSFSFPSLAPLFLTTSPSSAYPLSSPYHLNFSLYSLLFFGLAVLTNSSVPNDVVHVAVNVRANARAYRGPVLSEFEVIGAEVDAGEDAVSTGVGFDVVSAHFCRW